MPDKVKPLGLENSALGGTQDVPFPSELDPAEDYVAAKGLALENSDNHRIEKVGDEVAFFDPVSSAKKVSDLLDAEQENFDPQLSGLLSTKTGPAIREAADIATAGAARGRIPMGKQGNNNNVWLDYFRSISSDDTPYGASEDSELVNISLSSSDATDTFSVTIYKNGVSQQTFTKTNTTSKVEAFIISTPIVLVAGDGVSLYLSNGPATDPIVVVGEKIT